MPAIPAHPWPQSKSSTWWTRAQPLYHRIQQRTWHVLFSGFHGPDCPIYKQYPNANSTSWGIHKRVTSRTLSPSVLKPEYIPLWLLPSYISACGPNTRRSGLHFGPSPFPLNTGQLRPPWTTQHQLNSRPKPGNDWFFSGPILRTSHLDRKSSCFQADSIMCLTPVPHIKYMSFIYL